MSFNCFCQVSPDSLKGMYKGLYYFKYDVDSIWTITPDTEYVTFIDTINCSDQCHGDIGIFNVDGFETHYNYCYGNSSNQFTRFYGGDSLFIKWDNISRPPPNYKLYSNRFIGKRIPGTAWVGIEAVNINNEIEVFPNPTKHQIQIISNVQLGLMQVWLLDLKGAKVMEKPFNVQKSDEIITIDVSSILKGVYLLNISINNKSFNKKIVINN